MTRRNRIILVAMFIMLSVGSTQLAIADTFTKMLTEGKVSADFRLRYENVDQDNALKNADALTLRSRLGYTTGDFLGFSAMLEFEDSREVGVDNYDDGLGSNPKYSAVTDPETTELDQGFVQYHNWGATARLGRQVITLDNQRFVGDVGWRQDRQSFDAFNMAYQPIDNLKLTYAYINKRNRIFAEDRDLDSKDNLLNAAYKTPLGVLAVYGYLLEEDEGSKNDIDSFGVRFSGSTDVADTKVLYAAEFATQDNDTDNTDFDADYYLLEAGAVFYEVTGKIGYEVLGSDDGKYGFATPLATLHKFNGWADQFLTTPTQGLVDLYVSLGGKLFGGKWGVVYHDFEADEDTPGVDDLGDELDLVYSIKFLEHFNAGIKYAKYSEGDKGAGKVDTDKFWAWVGASF